MDGWVDLIPILGIWEFWNIGGNGMGRLDTYIGKSGYG
jgi:hypothetical protein